MSWFHNFQLKLVLKILRLEKKDVLLPKCLASYSHEMRIYFLVNDIMNIVENDKKDPIVENDKKADKFWLRIPANYNQYHGQLQEKKLIEYKN
ncbi:hypothetical protein MTR_8g018300 [Medicago truncatula]|uniref:Uncharacterized protein n=1 Tax=Medicago truncatula TaxID=3880 RepID=G7LI84_MEDTR|nr:hypothetical protein MTR_8g018300 [Medicago truncatula]